ncbi:hypothetical protein GCM10027091_14060 [Streptomyces daliensis]
MITVCPSVRVCRAALGRSGDAGQHPGIPVRHGPHARRTSHTGRGTPADRDIQDMRL